MHNAVYLHNWSACRVDNVLINPSQGSYFLFIYFLENKIINKIENNTKIISILANTKDSRVTEKKKKKSSGSAGN